MAGLPLASQIAKGPPQARPRVALVAVLPEKLKNRVWSGWKPCPGPRLPCRASEFSLEDFVLGAPMPRGRRSWELSPWEQRVSRELQEELRTGRDASGRRVYFCWCEEHYRAVLAADASAAAAKCAAQVGGLLAVVCLVPPVVCPPPGSLARRPPPPSTPPARVSACASVWVGQAASRAVASRAPFAVTCCDGVLMVDDPAVLRWMQTHFPPAAAALVPRGTLLVALQQFGLVSHLAAEPERRSHK